MEIEEKVLNFYRRVVFGKDYNKNKLTKENIYRWCFNNAWNDMARHIYDGEQNDDLLTESIIPLLDTGIKSEDIRTLIEKYNGMCVGKTQKVVNMFFKYLYTFKDTELFNNIEFSKCDCPVDRQIIQKINKLLKYTTKLQKQGKIGVCFPDGSVIKFMSTGTIKINDEVISWSGLKNVEVYKKIQDVIDVLKEKGQSRLDFDFENWGDEQE